MSEKPQQIDVKELLSYCDDLVAVLRDKRDTNILTQCLEHFNSIHSASDSDFNTTYVAFSDKVDLTLYYETLCPYCSYFIAHDLVRIFSSGLISIVNLRLVPWGNAGFDSSGNFQCQHGSGECLLNTVEACVIDAYPDPYKHYFVIQCIESLAYQKREAEWQSCFTRTSLDVQPIFDCYNQGNGRRLELQYAYETGQLNPPHSYVPWVLVNNANPRGLSKFCRLCLQSLQRGVTSCSLHFTSIRDQFACPSDSRCTKTGLLCGRKKESDIICTN